MLSTPHCTKHGLASITENDLSSTPRAGYISLLPLSWHLQARPEWVLKTVTSVLGIDPETKEGNQPWHCSLCPSGLWVSPCQPPLNLMVPCFSLPDCSLWDILVSWMGGQSPQQDTSFIRAKWWPASSTARTHSLEDSWLLYTDPY
jgi:hypothetical protein